METQPEISLMLFRMFGSGVGFDSRQIHSIQYRDENSDNVVPFHQLIDIQKREYEYQKPRVVSLKKADSIRILLEEPQDIITIDKETIYPLPGLLQNVAANTGLWGVVWQKNHCYFLYDTDILIRNYNG